MTTQSETVDEILQLLCERGDSQYGDEAVSKVEHALQTATLALENDADSALLHDLPDDAPDRGIDDRHEVSGGNWLASRFGPEVTEPVRLHVPAKRYLCAVLPAYADELSPPSVLSLKLQGGPMSANEVSDFESNPEFERAVQLRHWDDEAKIPDHPTPTVEDFRPHIEAALAGSAAC